MNKSDLINNLDIMIPSPQCELSYTKDYELLIAVMLSAQCTDKRVNEVTKNIFNKYDLKDLASLDIKLIEELIYKLGSYTKKAYYIKSIANRILNDCEGKIPNDRKYLESLPGVGHKTANVVLSELFGEPNIAVDTHVKRVSKRLSLAKKQDDEKVIECKLLKYFNKEEYNRVNHQLVLFGRYICTAKNPKCKNCLIKCKNKMED